MYSRFLRARYEETGTGLPKSCHGKQRTRDVIARCQSSSIPGSGLLLWRTYRYAMRRQTRQAGKVVGAGAQEKFPGVDGRTKLAHATCCTLARSGRVDPAACTITSTLDQPRILARIDFEQRSTLSTTFSHRDRISGSAGVRARKKRSVDRQSVHFKARREMRVREGLWDR